MSERIFGVIFAISAAILIAAISYSATLLPVPDNWVAGQAMPIDE